MVRHLKPKQRRRPKNERLRDRPSAPLIGYMRVSKADGSQVLDLQRDALLAAGARERHLYSDTASGKKDDRPGLAACLQALREGDTLVVWGTVASEFDRANIRWLAFRVAGIVSIVDHIQVHDTFAEP